MDKITDGLKHDGDKPRLSLVLGDRRKIPCVYNGDIRQDRGGRMNLSDIKRNLNHTVLYKDGKYKLVGCIFRQNEKTGDYFYQAELLDLRSGRSVVICRLEEVEKRNETKRS